jgi:hypothetical protein
MLMSIEGDVSADEETGRSPTLPPPAGWQGLRHTQPRSGPMAPGFASEPRPPSRFARRAEPKGTAEGRG